MRVWETIRMTFRIKKIIVIWILQGVMNNVMWWIITKIKDPIRLAG
jgi:hypothetical protein